MLLLIVGLFRNEIESIAASSCIFAFLCDTFKHTYKLASIVWHIQLYNSMF